MMRRQARAPGWRPTTPTSGALPSRRGRRGAGGAGAVEARLVAEEAQQRGRAVEHYSRNMGRMPGAADEAPPPPADERGVVGQDTEEGVFDELLRQRRRRGGVRRGQMVPVISIRLGPKWACGPEKTSLIKSSFSSINGGD